MSDPNDLPVMPALREEQVFPTGPAMLAVVNENITDNFAIGQPCSINLPSLWRLAYQVVNETAPMVIYDFKRPQ